MRSLTTFTLCIALLGPTSFAMAQTAAPAPVAPAAAAPAKPAGKPTASSEDKTAKSAKSKECSAQADAKSLHGKERKKFREECKRGA